jgi:cyclopropane fatty-acyl-phospholipid synthase-like methyltransferase
MIHPHSKPTPRDVAAHYDTLDQFYREIWGEHVHHGYWPTGHETPEDAAAALVDLVADRLDLVPGHVVCDIGCGYGATAQVLAETHDVAVTGITLSAVQHARAARRVAARGALTFEVRDWLANGFPSASFDRAYAIESTEHMDDKVRCFAEAFRTLRPGGRLVVCAWLANRTPRPWHVRHLLRPICQEGRLPGIGDEAEYMDLLRRAGFAVSNVEDISTAVARTWSVCVRRAVRRLAADSQYQRFVLRGNAHDRIFAITLFRMLLAYRTGAMRYAVLTATKASD